MDCSTRSIDTTSSLPDEFVCPITLALMKNPFRNTETGHCFEREAVMNWIYQGNTMCPLTRMALHPDKFILDTQLQRKIQKWKADQAFDESCSGEDDGMDDSADFDETIDNILALTTRIRSIAVAQRVPAKPTSVVPDESSNPSDSLARLADIRTRVLQRRDDRIKNIISKDENLTAKKTNDAPELSLAGLISLR